MHLDSYIIFLSDYASWTTNLKKFEVMLKFLWISPNAASPRLHIPANEDNWPAHYEEYVPISQVHPELWTTYESARRLQIQGAPEPPACGGGQSEIEELEGPEEQVRSDQPSAAARLSEREVRGNRKSRSREGGGIGSGDKGKVY